MKNSSSRRKDMATSVRFVLQASRRFAMLAFNFNFNSNSNSNFNFFSASGGNTSTFGLYTLHTFTSNGNFVVTGSKEIDILVDYFDDFSLNLGKKTLNFFLKSVISP